MSKISPLAKRALGFNHYVGPNSSQVTSGRRMFVELGDGRSAWAKRWADLIQLHVSDIGGIERISEAQLSICRRAAALECTLELYEARMSAGEAVDVDQYGRLAGRLCRLFELIGIRRALPARSTRLMTLPRPLRAKRGPPMTKPNDDEPLPIEERLDREPGEA